MGRLTLNVLLSFAQFEREVIGERIRDKVAASRKRGMWMGGFVPMGYEVQNRKLVIHEPEAATVRMIFERFLKVGSATAARPAARRRGRPQPPRQAHRQGLPLQAAEQPGLHRPRRPQGHRLSRRASGHHQPGPLGQGAVILRESPRIRACRSRAQTPALLKGLLFGPTGRAMSPDPHPPGRQALSLLRLPGRPEGRGRRRLPDPARVGRRASRPRSSTSCRALLRSPEVVVATWRAAKAGE